MYSIRQTDMNDAFLKIKSNLKKERKMSAKKIEVEKENSFTWDSIFPSPPLM